jgi:hypothetical protein
VYNINSHFAVHRKKILLTFSIMKPIRKDKHLVYQNTTDYVKQGRHLVPNLPQDKCEPCHRGYNGENKGLYNLQNTAHP